MNYYEYIVLDAMDIFYVFYDILLLIKKNSGFVYLLFFFMFVALEGKKYRKYKILIGAHITSVRKTR